MPLKNPKPVFDALRLMLGKLTQEHVDLMNRALAEADADAPGELVIASDGKYDVSARGISAIKGEEGLAKVRADGMLEAYPDPGSKDGNPWTIGRGSTGPDIRKGTIWTREQAEARFVADLRRFEGKVEALLGTAPTTQQQFDALVSFAYNVGVEGLRTSTLLAKHLAGDFGTFTPATRDKAASGTGAAGQFTRWIYNDGKPMDGLKNRRNREANLYANGVYPA